MVTRAGLRILHAYEADNVRSFAELCRAANYPTDLGGYYLRQLVKNGYLSKAERGAYVLTPKGRTYVATRHAQPNTAPRLHVMVLARIGQKYVVLQRVQQPFINRNEWPATIVNGGEVARSSLQRLSTERLAQPVSCEYKGTFRRIDTYNNELFDDKLFLVHEVVLYNNPQHDVVNGINNMYSVDELYVLENRSRSLLDIFEFVQSGHTYVERSYDLGYEDFDSSQLAT